MFSDNTSSQLPTTFTHFNNNDSTSETEWMPLSLPCIYCRSPVLLSFNFCNVCGANAPSISNFRNSDPHTHLGSSSNFPLQSHQPIISPFQNSFNSSQIINQSNDQEGDSEMAQKDEVCKFHITGKCRNGAKCKYLHQTHAREEDKSQVPSCSSSDNSDELSEQEILLRVIGALGLIPSNESMRTVEVLVSKLRTQANTSEPVAAQKAAATLRGLTASRPESSAPRKSLSAAEGAPSRNLYVHGFGAETDEAAVESLFSLFCEVKCVVMKEVLNRSTGEVDGRYCFVWTAGVEQATQAKQGLDQYNLNGNILQVSFAKERNSPLEEASRRKEAQGSHSPERERNSSESSSSNSQRPSRNLFVANFPERTSAEEIAALFAPYCEVKRVIMKSSGYCFVWTGSEDQATRALSSLNGRDAFGSTLQVAYAKEAKKMEERRSAKHHSPAKDMQQAFSYY